MEDLYYELELVEKYGEEAYAELIAQWFKPNDFKLSLVLTSYYQEIYSLKFLSW